MAPVITDPSDEGPKPSLPPPPIPLRSEIPLEAGSGKRSRTEIASNVGQRPVKAVTTELFKDALQQSIRFQVPPNPATFRQKNEPFSPTTQRYPPSQGIALPLPRLPFQMHPPPAPLQIPAPPLLGIHTREPAGLLTRDIASEEDVALGSSFASSVTVLVRALQAAQRSLTARKRLELFPACCSGPGAPGICETGEEEIKILWSVCLAILEIQSSIPNAPPRYGKHRMKGYAELDDIKFYLFRHSSDSEPPCWTLEDLLSITGQRRDLIYRFQRSEYPASPVNDFFQATPFFLQAALSATKNETDLIRPIPLGPSRDTKSDTTDSRPRSGMLEASSTTRSGGSTVEVPPKVAPKQGTGGTALFNPELRRHLNDKPFGKSFADGCKAYVDLCAIMPKKRDRDMVIHFVDCLWEGATMRGHADTWFRQRSTDFAVFEARVRGWSWSGQRPYPSVEHLVSEAVRAELLLSHRPKENPSVVTLWVTDFFRDIKIFVAGQQAGFIGVTQAAREDSRFIDHFATEPPNLPRRYQPPGNGDTGSLHSQGSISNLGSDHNISPFEAFGLRSASLLEGKKCGQDYGNSADNINSGTRSSSQAECKDNSDDIFDQLSRAGREAAGSFFWWNIVRRIRVLQSLPPVPHQGNGCPMVCAGWAKECDIFDPRDTSPPLTQAQLCRLLESAHQDGLIRVRVCGTLTGKICHYYFQTTSKFDALCEVLTASPNHLLGQGSTDPSSFKCLSLTGSQVCPDTSKATLTYSARAKEDRSRVQAMHPSPRVVTENVTVQPERQRGRPSR